MHSGVQKTNEEEKVMVLIKSPECDKEVGDKALKCPNCRHSIKSYSKE